MPVKTVGEERMSNKTRVSHPIDNAGYLLLRQTGAPVVYHRSSFDGRRSFDFTALMQDIRVNPRE